MRRLAAVMLLALIARPLPGQTEEVLRRAFEGKMVRVKIEMPGTSEGVEIRPGTSRPLDYSQNSRRLKQYGVALRPGDAVQVTKVHVKGDHIEFQLGAGGFGTMGDDASTSVSVPAVPKSQREKDVESEIKKTTDAAKKKQLNAELDRLRNDREREDARNKARAAPAQALKEETVRQRRLEGGSRFNIKYEHDVPEPAMTPESLMAVLAEYLDFSGDPGVAAPASLDDLRKGMSADEVDAMLGRPESIARRNEGTLVVSTSTYRVRNRKVTAEFVEGVLIRFTVSSQ